MKYMELGGWKYKLMANESISGTVFPNYEIEGYVYIRKGRLVVKKGYYWDGASSLAFDDKTNMRGSVFHDALYQLMREGKLDRKKYRKEADKLLRKICIEDAIKYLKTTSKFKKVMMISAIKTRYTYWYYAVRLRAGKSSMPRKNPRGQIIEIETKG